MKNFSFNDKTPPKGDKAKLLQPGAREKYATGKNELKRQVTPHKSPGKLGVQGHM